MPGYMWTEAFDEHENSVWELLAPYEDVQAYFRIRQRLRGNRVEYYDDSNTECTGDDEEWWYSLEHAKVSLEGAYDNILHTWDPED